MTSRARTVLLAIAIAAVVVFGFGRNLRVLVFPPAPPPAPSDVAAPPEGATRTASGLAYRVLRHGGSKETPKPDSVVRVIYTGWTPDGARFDSSVPKGEPSMFALNRVIAGWSEGVQLLHPGDAARFWIPAALAYGDKPAREGVPAGPLVFDVELVSIE